MKIWIIFIILCGLFAVPTFAQEVRQGTPELAEIVFGYGALARHTLRVIDDDGNPLNGIKVQMSFVMPGCQWIYGHTDTNGCFAAQGQSGGEVNYYIEKSGYYSSSDTINLCKKDGILVKDSKWQPWNPETTIVLRRIIDPIPMYARRMSTIIPVLNENVGFDLLRSDWVHPYGRGEITDIKVRIAKRFESYFDFDASLEIEFPGIGNGLFITSLKSYSSSELKLPRYAPENTVPMKAIKSSYSSSSSFSPDESISYFFRTRSQGDDNGKIVSALYGKIRGYFGFSVRRHETGSISFTYYLNPTPNDRNMEFDPKRNLFKDLRSTETVNEP